MPSETRLERAVAWVLTVVVRSVVFPIGVWMDWRYGKWLKRSGLDED